MVPVKFKFTLNIPEKRWPVDDFKVFKASDTLIVMFDLFFRKVSLQSLIFSQILFIFPRGSPFCKLCYQDFSVSLPEYRILFCVHNLEHQNVCLTETSRFVLYYKTGKQTRVISCKTEQCSDAKSLPCNYKLGISEESSLFNPLPTLY